jgi:hypothetical protein
MQELRLVAVSADGQSVILTEPGGRQFTVRIDDQLRAAVRRDRARLGQLQIQMEGTVRPREIQARIRAGETVEEIAAAAGVDVEHVRRYEGPIRAERDYVAAQARAVVPRRSQGRHASLADLVAERLHERLVERNLDADELEWDAWRRDDGTWTVRLSFPSGRTVGLATWRYDTSRRTVVAEDENAVWLTNGEQVSQPTRSLAAVGAEAPADPRELVYDLEADGGIDPAEFDRDLRRPAPERLTSVPVAPASSRPTAPPPVRSVAPVAEPEPVTDDAPDSPDTESVEHTDPETAADEPAASAAAGRRRSGRRASVPSWDDILLGTRRQP